MIVEMKITKIYTKTGDRGETSLVGGLRTAKDSDRIEAYGSIDELSSQLGLLSAMLSDSSKEALHPLATEIDGAQQMLFDMSALLATDIEKLQQSGAEWTDGYLAGLRATNDRIGRQIADMEKKIDELNASLPALNTFILPGGTMQGAQCHVCRAVCRRAERRVLTLLATLSGEDVKMYGNTLAYINRLSDYLYVMARKINLICEKEEKKWENSCK